MKNQNVPSFGVVIPTLNAGEFISPLLGQIERQSIKPLDVLVVDSSSDDQTTDQVAKHVGVRLIRINRESFDHGGTRHEAFQRVKGDFVCFLTQDAVLADDHYFENLLAPFSAPRVALVSGRQLPKSDARPFEALVRKFNYPDTSFTRSADDIERLGIKAFFASDVCSAYRRTAYMECGGFERPLNTNEDMAMAMKFLRCGFSVAYEASARVYHSHNLTPIQQFARNREVGVFLKRHSNDLEGVCEMGEGARLVKYVIKTLISERNYFEVVPFGVDCAARLIGNRYGRMIANKR